MITDVCLEISVFMCIFYFRFSYGYQQDYGMGPGPRPGMLSYEDGVSTDCTRIITYNIKYGGTLCKKHSVS